MIDYLLSFADEPTARTDAVVGAFWMPATDVPATWRLDLCIPNVQINTASTGVAINSNWNIIIAQLTPNAALRTHPRTIAWINRDTGQIISATALGLWRARQVFPLFAGATYGPSVFSA